VEYTPHPALKGLIYRLAELSFLSLFL